MYSYGQIERALATAYNVDGEAIGAFRGRIKHFQRIGIVPASPGKGQKLTYEKETAYRWAFCIELAEFGIDPTKIRTVVDFAWAGVRQALLQYHLENDVLFVAHPMMLSKAISSKHPMPELPFSVADDQKLALITRSSKLGLEEFERALVINLMTMRERVNAALALVASQ